MPSGGYERWSLKIVATGKSGTFRPVSTVIESVLLLSKSCTSLASRKEAKIA
jgi:hypothetical protein